MPPVCSIQSMTITPPCELQRAERRSAGRVSCLTTRRVFHLDGSCQVSFVSLSLFSSVSLLRLVTHDQRQYLSIRLSHTYRPYIPFIVYQRHNKRHSVIMAMVSHSQYLCPDFNSTSTVSFLFIIQKSMLNNSVVDQFCNIQI